MANRPKRPSLPLFAMHVFLTFLTGGAWLVIIAIWYLMKRR